MYTSTFVLQDIGPIYTISIVMSQIVMPSNFYVHQHTYDNVLQCHIGVEITKK